MNLIRLRERLKLMRKANAIHEGELHRGLRAPAFVMVQEASDITEEEHEWLRQNICDETGCIPKHLPFGELVLVLKQCAIFAWRYSDGIATVFFQVDDPSERWMRCFYQFGKLKDGIKVNLFLDGKSNNPPREADERFQSLANYPATCLARLCLAVMASASTTLKVSPEPKPGKSVEWHLARTHYLLVSRKQAVACRDQKRGPSDHELKRAAHWRKAHFRVLRSEKFTLKRGKTVRVRHAWVGPDEWSGLDKKIYKVVELAVTP